MKALLSGARALRLSSHRVSLRPRAGEHCQAAHLCPTRAPDSSLLSRSSCKYDQILVFNRGLYTLYECLYYSIFLRSSYKKDI